MSENKQIISDSEEILRTEYQDLMHSKEEFLMKVHGAEKTGLVTLYEQLEEEWRQMDLEKLKNELGDKSNLLMQNFPAESELKATLTKRYMTALEQEELKMRTARENLKKSVNGWKNGIRYLEEKLNYEGSDEIESEEWKLRTSKSDFWIYVKGLRNDMRKLEKQWRQRKSTLMESLKVARMGQELTDEILSNLKMKSNLQLEKLNSLSSELKMKLENYKEKWIPYQNRLNLKNAELKALIEEKKLHWKIASEQLRQSRVLKLKSLNERKQSYQEELNLLETKLKNNSEVLKDKLLKELRSEMFPEIATYPERLQTFIMQGQNYQITAFLEKISTDTKTLSDSLVRQLSKYGLKPEEIFQQLPRESEPV